MRGRAAVGLGLLALACTQCSLLLYNDDELSGGDAGASPDGGADTSADAVVDATSADSGAADANADGKTFPDAATVWPVNGHAYELVLAQVDWNAAKNAAQMRGGHLVTITDAQENDFVFALVKTNDAAWVLLPNEVEMGPWIGCIQPAGSPEPAGGFVWVTGEPFAYEGFGASQPDNSGGEDACHFLAFGAPRDNVWNDDHSADKLRGFLVEYE
jgi:hypothetical protein